MLSLISCLDTVANIIPTACGADIASNKDTLEKKFYTGMFAAFIYAYLVGYDLENIYYRYSLRC